MVTVHELLLGGFEASSIRRGVVREAGIVLLIRFLIIKVELEAGRRVLTLLRLQLLMLVFTHFLWLFIRLRFFTLQPLAETRSLECGFVGADLMM